MAIQQVASGGGNGIMSFLFHDDGGMEGTVLEGAEFARTLHQLLGDYDAAPAMAGDTAATPPGMLASGAETEFTAAAATMPLTRELEALASDFTLPPSGAGLPPESGWEAAEHGQEHEQPFWGIAPFTDMAAALREHANVAEANAAAAAPAHVTHDAAGPAAPAFGKGIQNLIELARDAEQLATQLAQAAPLPAPITVPATGRNAPAGGKFLPQPFRPQLAGANQVGGASQAPGKQVAVGNDALPAAASEAGFGTALQAFATEATNTEVRNPQGQPNATLAPGIQGLRNDSSFQGGQPKALAADTGLAPAQFDLPHVAGTEAWFEDLGTRVEWLNDMNIDSAELQLHPAELGLLEIQISNGDDGTQVSFVTHNAAARELIEDSLPRLRELLQNQGLQLGQSNVSQHSEGQDRGHEAHAGSTAPRPEGPVDEAAPQRRTVFVRDPNRIDHYV